MNITSLPIKIEEKTWLEYTLTNDSGMSVSFLNFGGIITKMMVPDKNNQFENVVIGFRDYDNYLNNKNYFGALIGRVAGRIEGAQFSLGEKTYTLPANDGDNSLHGGPGGLHARTWEVETIETPTSVGAVLYHTSLDGDQGYPGTVKYKVSYTLTNANDFEISYEAISDQDTVLTLTNHSYFNLSGDLKDTILNHEVTMNASQFVELDHALIPTGNILPVTDTVFDFRNGRKILDGTLSGDPQNQLALDGYDHFFIFDQTKDDDQITLKDASSGRQLTVTTDQPGVVMYTSNNLDDSLQLNEARSKKYLGVCLETQSSPASATHDGFPSIHLAAHEVYRKKTIFSFES